METMDLAHKRCRPCEGGVSPLAGHEVAALMQQLDGWHPGHNKIEKTYAFRDYYQTMAFVNAVAWLSHREDHHPDLSVGFKHCRVEYTTHAIGGLSENDFICAAKVDALFAL